MDAAPKTTSVSMALAPFLIEAAPISSLRQGGWLDILAAAVRSGGFTDRQEALAVQALARRLSPPKSAHAAAFERRILDLVERALPAAGARRELRAIFPRRTERLAAAALIADDARFVVVTRCPTVVERVS